MTETTENAFLNGRLRVLQPSFGYRAGADPVFLAAAVDARSGDHVLDVGCGVGTAMLCLMARVPGLRVTGVEGQSDLVALARRNLDANGVSGEIVQADIRDLPGDLRDRSFDHVMTNPPFFDRNAGSVAPDAGRERGRGETVGLAEWLDICLRRLAPAGRLTLINRIERLPDCLSALEGRAGDVVVQPLQPREGRRAKLFVLGARKGAKGPFRLNSSLILHIGDRHERDGESYAPAVQAILRDGSALKLNN